MLPDDVKPFLNHEDPIVRKFAVRYFDKLQSDDTDIMPLVLQGFRLPGSTEYRRRFFAYSTNLAQTDGTIEEIASSILTDRTFRDLGERVIINCGSQLLRNHKDVIQKLSEEKRRVAVQRALLADFDASTLFEKLIQQALSGHGKMISKFDYLFGVYIARELASRLDAPTDAMREWMDRTYREDYEGYENIYACVLAGLFGYEGMVSRLVDYLHIDTDLLVEEAARALSRIGSANVVSRILSGFPDGEWGFRLEAAGVLSSIKDPSSEAAILELLQREEDVTIRTVLANGLCELLSVEGIPVVKQVISEGYDERMLDLGESLYANCVINGIDDSELPNWKAHVLETQPWYGEVEKRKGSIGLQTVVNTVKVGRNDPCPCGSGKKYKKCCGA